MVRIEGIGIRVSDPFELSVGRYKVSVRVHVSSDDSFSLWVFGPDDFRDLLFSEFFDGSQTFEGSTVLEAESAGTYYVSTDDTHSRWSLLIEPLGGTDRYRPVDAAGLMGPTGLNEPLGETAHLRGNTRPRKPSMNGHRRHWIRRHPFLTGLLALWMGLLVLAIAVSDEIRDAGSVAAAAVLTFAATGVALAIAWPIDRWNDWQRRRMARGSPSSMTPVDRAPTSGPAKSAILSARPDLAMAAQAIPHDVSALEETTHVHLPDRPSGPSLFKPVTLGDLLAMTPTEFEQLCVRALLVLGYDQVRRTGGAGDLAADITGKDAQGRSVIVQCKRYAPGSAVGSPVIQTFIGMKAVHHKADRGIVMTTAEFSKPAIQLAKQHDIVLIDGDDIVKLLNLMGTR